MRLFVSMLLATLVVMATLIDDSASASTHKRSLLDVLEEEKVSNGWKQVATHENGLPYNLLGSPMFVAPRPTDTKAIDLMCRFIQETPLLPNVEHDDEDVTAPNWDLLYADRSEDAAVCCQMEGNEQELCIEALRQKAVDQYCYFWDHSMENDLGVNEPCCEETGEGRVQCMDQARYGFDVDIHSTDRSIEILPVTVVQRVKQQLMKVNKPPAFDNNFCTWAKQQPHVDTAFEEATLQRLDPMQKISEVTRKLISCCYINGDEPTIDQCMSSVREESLDQMCLKEKVVDSAVPLIDPSVITNIPAGLKAIMSYNDDIPAHPCCQRSYTNRYSCFSQEWCGFKAHRDTYDHTDEITQYSEKFEQFTSKVTANLGYSSIDKACDQWYGGKVLPESVEEIDQEEENMGKSPYVACKEVAKKLDSNKQIQRSRLTLPNLNVMDGISHVSRKLCEDLFPNDKGEECKNLGLFTTYGPALVKFFEGSDEDDICGEFGLKMCPNPVPPQCMCEQCNAFIGQLGKSDPTVIQKVLDENLCDALNGKEKEECKTLPCSLSSFHTQPCDSCEYKQCKKFIGQLDESYLNVVSEALNDLCDELSNGKEQAACKNDVNSIKITDFYPLCEVFCKVPARDDCPDLDVCQTCEDAVPLVDTITKEDLKFLCGRLFPDNNDRAESCTKLIFNHADGLKELVKEMGPGKICSDELQMCIAA
ncbi:uncharacterized protein [Branchiostoma lanceolatum]|uniref:uncharacterized protein n=1 Tax=Branchiostoma lanceolatum TaxID=7740 RepID=UPI0034515999